MAYRLYFVSTFLFWHSFHAVALAAVEVALAAVVAADSPSHRRKVLFLVRRDLLRLPSVGFLRLKR